MRMIDADALIGKLHNYRFYDGDDRTLVYAVIENQPTIEPQKWIPCSERLPEEKKEVLVSADGDLYIAILETINGKSFWSEVIEYRYIMGVDAWMPLPEPWKEEEQ